MTKAMLKSVDYIRNNQSDILAIIAKRWGIEEPVIRESIYRDIVKIYTRNGVAADETMKNVVQLVRSTRKSKDELGLADIVDWSFAKKAQAELKIR